jgi:uncharacterized protein YkwD
MKIPSVLKALPMMLALAGCGTLLGTPETAATTLNGFRAAHGRPALRSDMALAAMASSHAAYMARHNRLDHAGFREYRGPRGARAENVAYGCADSACVIRQWANSSGHRRNMLRTDVSKYGLASATSASGKRYWVLELGE